MAEQRAVAIQLGGSLLSAAKRYTNVRSLTCEERASLIGRCLDRRDSEDMMDGDMRNRRTAMGAPPFERVASWPLAVSFVAAIEAMRRRQGNDEPGLGANGGPALALGRASWIAIVRGVYESFQKNRILAVSAGVTFYSLLAIFPALAALLSVYGLFADLGTVESHLAALADILPSGAIEIIGEQIKRIANASNSNLGLAFFIGLAASLWSANAGMRALIDGLNVAYAKPEKRGFIKLALVSLGFTAGAILAVLAALSLIVALPAMLDFIGLGGLADALVTYGRWPALLSMVILGLAVLYRYGAPPHGARWRWITPGSAIAAIIWLAASVGFSFYAAHFGSYNKTYGSLGAAVGFMTWMWLSIIVILTGAELNSNLEALHKAI